MKISIKVELDDGSVVEGDVDILQSECDRIEAEIKALREKSNGLKALIAALLKSRGATSGVTVLLDEDRHAPARGAIRDLLTRLGPLTNKQIAEQLGKNYSTVAQTLSMGKRAGVFEVNGRSEWSIAGPAKPSPEPTQSDPEDDDDLETRIADYLSVNQPAKPRTIAADLDESPPSVMAALSSSQRFTKNGDGWLLKRDTDRN